MKTSEIRALDDKALAQKLADFQQEIFNLRFQHATAQLENTQRIKDVKKLIAVCQTIMNERKAGA